MEEQSYSVRNDDDNELIINIKNVFLAIWNRKFLIFKIFTLTLVFFIAMTYILPKKWTVTANLYINKANNTNYFEVNPYAIEEVGGLNTVFGGKSDPLANEIALVQSPLVMDKVIRENNLRFQKLFDIIPTAKTGEYLTTDKFLKKGIKIETVKDTKIMSISYTSKYKDTSYNVVNSIINNYIKLYQEINSKKSKSDKAILQSEYDKAKADLNKKMNSAGGLPSTSLAGAGSLTAMSSFSRSARNAMANMQGQYISGEKSRIEVTESASKVSQLAQKLEWANLVDEMSDVSKVLVIKEPYKLRNWEYSSPKLFIDIILGIIFGVIFSIIGFIYKEITDKKLSYSMIGNDVIYDLDKEYNKLCAELISNSEKKTALVYFEDLADNIKEKLKNFTNVVPVKAEITSSFKTSVKNIDNIVLLEKINKTSSEDYKLIKHILESMNKKIIYEVLTD